MCYFRMKNICWSCILILSDMRGHTICNQASHWLHCILTVCHYQIKFIYQLSLPSLLLSLGKKPDI